MLVTILEIKFEEISCHPVNIIDGLAIEKISVIEFPVSRAVSALFTFGNPYPFSRLYDQL